MPFEIIPYKKCGFQIRAAVYSGAMFRLFFPSGVVYRENLKPGMRYQFAWGTGVDVGSVMVSPSEDGVTLHALHAVRDVQPRLFLSTSRIPDWLQKKVPTMAVMEEQWEDGVLLLRLPPQFICGTMIDAAMEEPEDD